MWRNTVYKTGYSEIAWNKWKGKKKKNNVRTENSPVYIPDLNCKIMLKTSIQDTLIMDIYGTTLPQMNGQNKDKSSATAAASHSF